MALNTYSLEVNETNGSYAHAPHISAYNVTSITIECWCYRFSTDVFNKDRGLIDKGRDGYVGWSLRMDGTTQKAQWQIRNGGASRNVVSSTVYPKDTWFHLAATYDGSTMYLYQDGSQVGTLSTSGTLATNSIDIFMGRFNDGANGSIDCRIDEVRIWDTNRSSTEINDNKDVQLEGDETNLIGYWRLNNDYTDETSNANTLTAVASPTFNTSVPFPGTADAAGDALAWCNF